MIHTFTQTIQMDWMLPGIPPTGKRVEVPLVVIVGFRDGKIAYERIYWDQASVLVQIGLLDPDTLPVVGIESARKVLDPTLPSNLLIMRASQRKERFAHATEISPAFILRKRTSWQMRGESHQQKGKSKHESQSLEKGAKDVTDTLH